MVIDSPAFHQFCTVLGARIPAEDLRRLLYESGFPLGAIRRVAFRQGLPMDFKRVNVACFIDEGPACVVHRCCEEVASLNSHLDLSADSLIDFTEDEVCLSLPRAHVVRGHDLVAILESQSRTLFGRVVSQRELEYELAAAFTFNHFERTRTYTDLREWEDTVLPTYRLFL
jgi:hypothetical protein